MESGQILTVLEDTLDALIHNAQLLQDETLDDNQLKVLKDEQDLLLTKLFQLQSVCQESVSHQEFQKNPDIYTTLTDKTKQLSVINRSLLRSKSPQPIYKHSQHRLNRKPSHQLFLDLPQ